MKVLLLICLILCSIANRSFSQSTQSFCKVSDDLEAASRMVAEKPAHLAAPCGNYYVNVFFHFIRDNNGATGQSVNDIPQFMNILNGAFNGQNVFFIYKGHDEIRNNSYAATGYDFSSNFDN